MALSENQRRAHREDFFKNGLYLPTRTIVFGTNSFKEDSEITDADLVDFIKSLHILEELRSEDDEEDLIKIVLSSTGGDLYLGFAVYDAIKACKSPVEIRAIGNCMSAATLVLQAGDYRYCYPNTTFMIHKGTMHLEEVSVSEAVIESRETERMVQRMIDTYAQTMTVSRDTIEQMMEKDTFMDAAKAKKVGLIDGWKESFDL